MKNYKLPLSLIFLMLFSSGASAHFGHHHGHDHSEDNKEKTFLSYLGYAGVTTFNVLELWSHLKVMKDLIVERPQSLSDAGLLIWNGAEIYGHSMNAVNYGTEILHDGVGSGEAPKYSALTLTTVNAATAMFQGLTLYKYWHKEKSLANKAVIIQTAADFVFHSWDFYYSASKSLSNANK